MLDSISRPGHAAWFAANRSDPGYTAWRSQADVLAKDNSELKTKLAELDSKVELEKLSPTQPDLIPVGVRADQGRVSNPFGAAQAVEREPQTGSSAYTFISSLLLIVFVVGMGLILALLVMKLLRNHARKEDASMKALSTLTNIAKARVTDAKPRDPFRLGQVIMIDGSLFLLAGAASKVKAPEGAGVGPSPVSITALSKIEKNLWWLHLSDDSYLQIHLDDAGKATEARYFSLIDEVYPASADDWGFWLDDQDGMIGYPVFETKDGKQYNRIWQAGETRVEPRRIVEQRTGATGTREITHSAMLYGCETGRQPPSPTQELLLVDAIEDGQDASIRIHAGIDIAPSSLSLI